MRKSERVAVLVDSENLEISAHSRLRKRSGSREGRVSFPNWMTILPRVVGSRTLVRNIYYKKKGLLISPKFRTLWETELHGEFRQPPKSVDPYIIVDAISLATKMDTIIILAGDKDYLPVIAYLRALGCKVEFASFAEAAARSVRSAADKFHLLTSKDTLTLRTES